MLIFNPFITFSRGPIGPRQILDSYPDIAGEEPTVEGGDLYALTVTETGESYLGFNDENLYKRNNRVYNDATSTQREEVAMGDFPVERDLEFDWLAPEPSSGFSLLIYCLRKSSGPSSIYCRISHDLTDGDYYYQLYDSGEGLAATFGPDPYGKPFKFTIRRNVDNPTRVDVEWLMDGVVILSGTSINDYADTDNGLMIGSYSKGDVIDNLVITDRSEDE